MSRSLASSTAVDKDNVSSRVSCDVCQMTFARREHLKRHQRSHLNIRPFQCSHCSRTFTRKDAAQRHEKVHDLVGGTSSPNLGVHTATRRTCNACISSHIKCPGGSPCSSCLNKNLKCVYPRRKKRHPAASIYSTSLNSDNLATTSHENVDTIDLDEHHVSSPQSPSINPVAETVANRTQPEPIQIDTNSPLVENHANSQSSGNLYLSTRSMPASTLHHSTLRGPQPTNWLSPVSSGEYRIDSHQENYATSEPSTQSPDHLMRTAGNAASHLRRDGFAALVDSMMTGLPGFGNAAIQQDSAACTGQPTLYADGTGSRSSQVERRARERRPSRIVPLNLSNHNLSWIDLLRENANQSNSDNNSTFQMPQNVYDDIITKTFCHNSDVLNAEDWSTKLGVFMEKPVLDHLIQLYFVHFHTVYPFLDQSMLCIPVWGWALCLATAGIGARFFDVEEITENGDSLCGLVHRLLVKELSFGCKEDSLPYLQARVLAAVGMCHSAKSTVMSCGYGIMANITHSCLRLRLLDEDDRIGAWDEEQNWEQMWIAWRFREMRRRTGFFIWLIDMIVAFVVGIQPRMPLSSLRLVLPSSEDLWEANTYQKWVNLFQAKSRLDPSMHSFYEEEKSRMTMREMVATLRDKLTAPVNMSDYTLSIAIHVLIRHVWDATQYYNDPPRVQNKPDNGRHDWQSHRQWYLGAIPDHMKWRNATCDCLDVLHCNALSVSAKAGGNEGPSFLQLHLARLFILSPICELFGYVGARIDPTLGWLLPHELYNVSESDSRCQETVRTWIRRDRYKARLAVVHAGAIFWHIRRYSSDSFLEPFAIYLAAICLYSFAKATIQLSEVVSSSSNFTESDTYLLAQNDAIEGSPETITHVDARTNGSRYERRIPQLIILDRPIDDELVQFFIRSAERMKILLEGVPDLCSPVGAQQVLEEAVTMLDTLTPVWTVSRLYATHLTMVGKMSCSTDNITTG